MPTTSDELLINFRMPRDLKNQFQDTCRRNHSTMTTELIRFVTHYLAHNITEHPIKERAFHTATPCYPATQEKVTKKGITLGDTVDPKSGDQASHQRKGTCPETGLPLEFWS
jgi:hypothetical protein